MWLCPIILHFYCQNTRCSEDGCASIIRQNKKKVHFCFFPSDGLSFWLRPFCPLHSHLCLVLQRSEVSGFLYFQNVAWMMSTVPHFLDIVLWSATRPGRTLPPGKTLYPFYRSLSGSQGRSGRAENLIPTGIRSRTVQPVVSRYTDWATRPTWTVMPVEISVGNLILTFFPPKFVFS